MIDNKYDENCDCLEDSVRLEHFYNPSSKISTFKNGLRLIHLNIQGIKSKIDGIACFVNEFRPDIIIFSETHFKYDETPYYNLQGFKAFHSVRFNKKGGGVSIYVASNIPATLAFEINDTYNNFIGVKLHKLKLNIIGIYKSNNPANDNGEFMKNLENVLINNKNSYVLGDFNFDLLKSNTLSGYYADTIDVCGYKILNFVDDSMPTRIDKVSGRRSILDHALTNSLKNELILSIYDNHLSDHDILALDISLNSKSINNSNIIIKKLSYESIISEILDVNLDTIVDYDEFDDKVTKIIQKYNTQTIFKSKRNYKKPYITPKILDMIKKKELYYKLKKKFPNSELFQDLFKKFRNSVANSISMSKKKYFNSKFDENIADPKKTMGIDQ